MRFFLSSYSYPHSYLSNHLFFCHILIVLSFYPLYVDDASSLSVAEREALGITTELPRDWAQASKALDNFPEFSTRMGDEVVRHLRLLRQSVEDLMEKDIGNGDDADGILKKRKWMALRF